MEKQIEDKIQSVWDAPAEEELPQDEQNFEDFIDLASRPVPSEK